MARVRPAARRYAEAVFALAAEDNSYDAWAADLDRLGALLEVPVVAKALDSPAVPISQKLAVIAAEAPGLRPQTNNLIRLLLHRERLELLPEIAASYRELLNRARGIAVADVVTAVPLDEASRAQLASRLERYVGQKVEMQTSVDPSIIGGVVVRVGDTLLDGSVRGRLEALRRRLAATG
ncbi:MAG TPA: F0F1 ATP synthase subunit delta [Chloroflexota bacterium]|nr:F0F1 ATP synthase subunit delta [Chloroflexota bacterium]